MAARKWLVDQAQLADSGMARHKTSLSVWLRRRGHKERQDFDGPWQETARVTEVKSRGGATV
jgi:hypothetical protein